MDVNHHSLVVLDAGAEVLPDHNVPVSTELNQEVFRFENPDPAHLLTQPAQYSLGCQLWFPLSDRQVEKISQDFTLFYTTYFPLLSNPTNLSQASVQISTISLSCDATVITFRERDKLFLPGLHL